MYAVRDHLSLTWQPSRHNRAGQHGCRIDANGMAEVHELNDVDPSFSTLDLGHEGLRRLEVMSEVDLGQSGGQPRLLQRTDQGTVLAAVGEGGHGRSNPGRPRN